MTSHPQTDRRVSPLLPRRSEAARRAPRSSSDAVALQERPVRRAAQAFLRIHTALDRFARWSPLIALVTLALVARAVIGGLLA